MIREMDRTNGNWYRSEVGIDYPFPNVPDNEITRFPYAILEVKLQTAAGDKVCNLQSVQFHFCLSDTQDLSYTKGRTMHVQYTRLVLYQRKDRKRAPCI